MRVFCIIMAILAVLVYTQMPRSLPPTHAPTLAPNGVSYFEMRIAPAFRRSHFEMQMLPPHITNARVFRVDRTRYLDGDLEDCEPFVNLRRLPWNCMLVFGNQRTREIQAEMVDDFWAAEQVPTKPAWYQPDEGEK
jgi:hypothetical protein